jgi:hypothetical protein
MYETICSTCGAWRRAQSSEEVISMSEETRDVPEEESEGADEGMLSDRRQMIKSAAAMAAAALGGAALGGSAAEAQVDRPPMRVQAGQLQMQSNLVQGLKIQELSEPLKNLGQLDPQVNQDMVPIILTDIGAYLQPLLDRGGGQVSSINVNVASSITLSG